MTRNNNNISNKSLTTASNAFSDLVGPLSTATSYNNSSIGNMASNSNYYGFATVAASPPSMPTVTLSSIQVSQPPTVYGITTNGSNNNDDAGFFMGGSTGAGLIPTGHAPASAPPPPPPSFY